jgi:hypothetical protein
MDDKDLDEVAIGGGEKKQRYVSVLSRVKTQVQKTKYIGIPPPTQTSN